MKWRKHNKPFKMFDWFCHLTLYGLVSYETVSLTSYQAHACLNIYKIRSTLESKDITTTLVSSIKKQLQIFTQKWLNWNSNRKFQVFSYKMAILKQQQELLSFSYSKHLVLSDTFVKHTLDYKNPAFKRSLE